MFILEEIFMQEIQFLRILYYGTIFFSFTVNSVKTEEK